jgi:hypothetical protein
MDRQPIAAALALRAGDESETALRSAPVGGKSHQKLGLELGRQGLDARAEAGKRRKQMLGAENPVRRAPFRRQTAELSGARRRVRARRCLL